MSPTWKSISRQAGLRLFFSLGLFVVLLGMSSYKLYSVALEKSAQERAENLATFYQARLLQLDRDWELQARDFKVRLEVTRLLEARNPSLADLNAFMTIQGTNRRFQYLLIENRLGREVFAFGASAGIDFDIPAGRASTWYYSKATSNLYRVFIVPIWLGEAGTGRMAVFYEVDHSLLFNLATPGITLAVLRADQPVASSIGQEGLRQGTADRHALVEKRDVSWGDNITLSIHAPAKVLFTQMELAVTAAAIPIVDGLILWLTLGFWLMHNARRIKELGGAVEAFSADRAPTPLLASRLDKARGQREDEITDVANAVEDMAGQIQRALQTLELRESKLNREIEERRQAEEALRKSEEFNRSIIASSADCIKVLDLEGNLLSVSEGGLRLLEIDDVGRYLQSCWVDFWQEQDQPAVREAIAMARAGRTGQFQAYCPSEKGKPKWWDVVVTAIPGPGGGLERLLAVSRDVTDRKQWEDALKEAKTEAERANQAKSHFLAAASHDLRQPLFALNLYISALENKLVPGNDRILSNLKESVGSLSEMLSKLLDLSKLEAGVITPETRDFPIAEALAAAVSAFAAEAQLKGLRLDCIPSRLIARTDPVLFGRILGNLVSNAVRYAERGGVAIGCRRRQGRVWVEVWDTGIGIPGDKTAEIFEEFKQLGNAARNSRRGSGLGLAIVARTAALLGLQIRVQSRLGKGSTFAVELPLGEEVSADVLPEYPFRPLRVAVVDDDGLVLEALSVALEALGHDVIAAATGREILGLLGGRSPDLVISDYRLAGAENGFDVISAVRAVFGRHLPAMVVTGDTDPVLLRQMAEQGVVVQHKPLKLPELQRLVAQLTTHSEPDISAAVA